MQNTSCTEPYNGLQSFFERPKQCYLDDGGPCECCVKLAELDRRTEEFLRRVEQERQVLLTKINRRHDPFILRLPIELSSRIFQFCMPSDEENGEDERLLDWYFEPLGIDEPPWAVPQILAMVCSQWRQIASSTARLWTSMPIYLFDKTERLERQLDILRRRARWAGSLPLSIGIWVAQGTSYSDFMSIGTAPLPAMKLTFDFMNSLSSRWKRLRTFLPQNALHLVTGNGKAPLLLQDLRVEFIDHFMDRRVYAPFALANGERPSPTKLVLQILPFQSVGINWSQLVDLSLTCLYTEDTVAILQKTPLLQRLHIQDTLRGRSPWFQGELRHVVHENLQSLSIYKASAERDPLWDFFTFPSLINFDCQDPNNGTEALMAMISRSKCVIKTCSFIQMLDQQTWSGFLDLMPSVIEISVHDCLEASLHILEILTQNRLDSSQPLSQLSKLERLEIELEPKYMSPFDMSRWWQTYLAFLDALAQSDTLPLISCRTTFTDATFPVITLPVEFMLNRLMKLMHTVACMGLSVSIVDKNRENLLNYLS